MLPGDKKLIDEVNELKSKARKSVENMSDGLLTISDQTIIKAAWGPRVTSSRTRGMVIHAYPSEITAHKKLWISWIDEVKDYVTVVIAKKKAQARIDAALSLVHKDPELQQPEPISKISQEEIDDMIAERRELREAKDFVSADKIRDYLISHGVIMSDKKIS